jgi:hypothetical protein
VRSGHVSPLASPKFGVSLSGTSGWSAVGNGEEEKEEEEAAAERNRLPTPESRPANLTMGYCGVRETNPTDSQQGTAKGESTFTMPSILAAGELPLA